MFRKVLLVLAFLSFGAFVAFAGGGSDSEVYTINFATNQPASHVVGPAYQGLVDELNEEAGPV